MSSASEGDDSRSQPQPLCVFFLTPLQPPALLPPLQLQPPRPRAARGERLARRKSPARGSRRDRGQQRGHAQAQPRQAWPPPRSASPDRAPKRSQEMGTGGRAVAVKAAGAPRPARHAHCHLPPQQQQQQQPLPRPQPSRAGAAAGVPLSGLPLRRYSVPETVMRRCSLRSGQSLSSDSGDGLSPTRDHEQDHGQGKIVKGKDVLDHNHNETSSKRGCSQCASVIRVSRSEVRCARRVSVERSAQCSAKSSTISSERTCTACSECYSQLTTMHEEAEAQWSESSSERLCVHCGRRTAGSKPCTPKDSLVDRYQRNVSLKVEDPKNSVNHSINLLGDKNVVMSESKVVSTSENVMSREVESSSLTMATQTQVSDFPGSHSGRDDRHQTNRIKASENVFQGDTKSRQPFSHTLSTRPDSSPSKKVASQRMLREGQPGTSKKDNSSVSVKVSQDENTSKVQVISKEDKGLHFQDSSEFNEIYEKKIPHRQPNQEVTRQDLRVTKNSLTSQNNLEDCDIHLRANIQSKLDESATNLQRCRERPEFRSENIPPELISASEDASSSFNISLAEMSTNDSTSPTPTPSPTTFRSRRPSSERLSTPESLRSGPIEPLDMNLKSSSSSGSLDQSVRFSQDESEQSLRSAPTTPERARNPRFGTRTSSSLDTRTPTPGPQEQQNDYTGKVHVVSETSSFIILDELDKDEEPPHRCGMDSSTQFKVKYRDRRLSQSGRGASFEVLTNPDFNAAGSHDLKSRLNKAPTSGAMPGKRKQRHKSDGCDLKDMDRDSLSGSAVDMFGVDEEGNILFSESGVQSRRGSKYSCADENQEGHMHLETNGCLKNATSVPCHTSTHHHANDANNNINSNRLNCAFHTNNNINAMNSTNNCNGYRETVKSDHHSQEQTFFCGVKEVYSVTTEKVEKWGSESREWLEKTTSHRIQHQHPHQTKAANSDKEKQYNPANRINAANSNPILIASEILEIPPEQRFRTSLNQPHGRSAVEQDFTLPSIRPMQDPNKLQTEWGKSTTLGGRRQGDVPEPQPSAPDMTTAHVRFVNDDQYDWSASQQYLIEQQNAQRQRRIVTDLVGTEPAEVHVAVPRYSALPRTRSMLVNTSSGEEDADGNDSDSECLSCADSLESEHTPRSAVKHDDKPVRGQVVAVPKTDRKSKKIRIHSPKSFFVSLSEDQTEEEDIPMSARMPNNLRDKLMERHTFVKLQMAQNKRFLRTVCDASMLQAHPTRSVRVGVSNVRIVDKKAGDKSELDVAVEMQKRAPMEDCSSKSTRRDKGAQTRHQPSKGDESVVRREKSRGKREVPAVVRVHKCHTEEQIKTTFKAKPYKVSGTAKICEPVSTHDKHQSDVAHSKRHKEETGKRTHIEKNAKRNVKVQVKTDEVKNKSHVPQKMSKSSQVKFVVSTGKNLKDESSQVFSKDRKNNSAARSVAEKAASRLDATWSRSDYEKSSRGGDVSTKDQEIIEHTQIAEVPQEKRQAQTQSSRHRAKTLKEVTQTKATHVRDYGIKRPIEADIATLKEVSHAVQTQTTPRLALKEAEKETEKMGLSRSVELTSVMKQKQDKTHTEVRLEASTGREQKHCGREAVDSEQPCRTERDAQKMRSHPEDFSAEVASRIRVKDNLPKVEDTAQFEERHHPPDKARGCSSIMASLKTTINDQSEAFISLPITPNDLPENRLQNYLEMGHTVTNSGMRKRHVEVETTIQKNIVHHNIVETERTVEKNVITKRTSSRSMDARSVTPKALYDSDTSYAAGVEVQVPTPTTPPVTPRPVLALNRTSRASVPAPTVRRQTPVQRFQQRFEVIPEEKNGNDENRRFIIEDSLSVAEDSPDGHSSTKGRAALHPQPGEVDLLTLSKGWINFYQMKDLGETEDGITMKAPQASVERVEYTMQIRAVPEPPAPTHASVAVGSSPPPKAVDAAVSMTADAGVSTTSTVDAAVSATRPVDVGVSATRPVDAAVSATRTIDAAVLAAGHVDAAVSPRKPVDAAVSATRPVDVAMSTTKTVDAAVLAMRPVDVAVSTRKSVDAAVSATRPVDVAVSTTKTVNAAVLAAMPVDAAVSTRKPVDAGVSATRPVDAAVFTREPVDVGVSASRTVDAAVSATRTVDASVSTTRDINEVSTVNVSAQKSPNRTRRPIVPGRPTAPRTTQRKAGLTLQKSSRRAAPQTVSKASGPVSYQARAVGTTDLEDASTNTLCGPLLPPPLPKKTEACTMTRSDACTGTSNAIGAQELRDGASAVAGVSSCGIVPISSCRRTELTRQDKLPKILTTDISDVLSTSSDSTEYMAPPGARATDWESTSPCWRRGLKTRQMRVGRAGRTRDAPVGLYQHQVPPQPQQAGPPPRDGVGWTVTLAGAGAKQQGSADLEMRLMFPADEKATCKGQSDTKDSGVNTQPVLSAPPGRWSLTIRNQLPGDADSSQGLSLSMVPPGPQECSSTDKRVGRSALADKSRALDKPSTRRPLSLIWPRMHQDACVAAPEMSEAETVLSVTGSAIQRKSRRFRR